MAEEQIIEAPQVQSPEQQDGGGQNPPNDSLLKLYKGLKEQQLYTKSFEDFQKKYSDSSEIDKLHEGLSKMGLYTKNKDDFYQKYFPSVGTKTEPTNPAIGNTVDFSKMGNYIPGVQSNEDFLKSKAQEANNRLSQELQNSNQAIGSILSKGKMKEYSDKLDAYRRNDAKGPLPTPDFTFTTAERDKQAEALKPQLAQDPLFARQVLQEQAKLNPERAGQIKADIYRIDAKDRGKNAQQIDENAKKIESGDLDYNLHNGRVLKNEGFWGSFGSAYDERMKARDDYDFISTASPDKIKERLEIERNSHNPDEPVNNPYGVGGFFGHAIGGQNPLGLATGAAVALVPGAEEVAPWAAAYVSSPEIHAISYVNSLRAKYNELRDKGEDPNKALDEAQNTASFDANVDLAQGALMTAAGTKAGLTAVNPTLSKGFMKAVTTGAESMLKNTAKEAIPQGFLAAGLQGLKNMHEGKPIGEGMTEAGAQTAGLVAGIGLLLKAPSAILKAPKIVNQIRKGLAENEGATMKELGTMVSDGTITSDEANKVTLSLEQQKEVDKQIPLHISDEDTRLDIQGLIEHRAKLEEDLKTLNKAYHPAIKKKIESIDEDIQKLSDVPVKEKPEGAEPEPKPTEGEKQLTALPNTSENETNQTEAETQAGDGVLNDQAGQHGSGPAIIRNVKLKDNPIASFNTSKGSEYEVHEDGTTTRNKALRDGDNEQGLQPEIAGTLPEQQTENQNTGQEKVINPDPGGETTGITHAQMDATAKEFGLPTYQEDPEKVTTWDKQADERFAKDSNAMGKLLDKMRNGIQPDAVEQRMMIKYIADLKAKIRVTPTDELLTQLKRAKDLSNIVGGRDVAKSLRARQSEVPVEESLADFMVSKMEATGVSKLTDEQKQQAATAYEKIDSTQEALQEKIDQLKQENAKLKATNIVNETVKKTPKGKKTREDFAKERSDIITKMRQDLLKAAKGGGGAMLNVPYASQLIAIAPHVGKLVKSIVEEGVIKLDEVVSRVHEHIKEILPEATKKDIHDIIAGEYNQKRETKNEISAKLRDLRDQAALINKLETLEKGGEPKTEKTKVKRNQEIENLKQKIKEHDVTKLANKKSAIKQQISKYEEKLSKGDFDPEQKKEIELDKAGIALRDKYLKAKEDWEIELMKDEYGKRSAMEKVGRGISEVVSVGRVAKSSFDVSMPLRQGLWGVSKELLSLPIGKNSGFKSQRQLVSQFGRMYRSLASEKVSRRIMADIHESPRFDVAQKSGLNIADPNSRFSEAREEVYGPSLAERIPFIGKPIKLGEGRQVGGLVKASERAATTFVNTMKWDIFNNYVDLFEKQGKTFENSTDLYEAAATYANQAVGRGKLPESVERANQVTSKIFFSLRLQASRLQLLTYLANPNFYAKVPKEIRVAYLKDMAKFVALGTATLGIAHAAGLNVGVNPYASNFGKIQVGDTEYDIWGGFSQWAVLLSRLVAGKSTDAGGHTKDLGAEKGQKSRGDLLLRFARSKLSPEAGVATNLLTGKDYLGSKTDLKTEAINFANPLITQDIYQVSQDGGVQQAFITAILAAHGVGVQTYEHPKIEGVEQR